MQSEPLRTVSDTPRVLKGQVGYKRYCMLRKIKNARWFRIADAISGVLEDTYKYTKWEHATCGGKAGILSMYIDQACAGVCHGERGDYGCPGKVRFIYSERSDSLKLCCGGPQCPAKLYAVEWNQDTGAVNLLEEGYTQRLGQVEVPRLTQRVDSYASDEMMEAARQGDMKLAKVLRKLAGEDCHDVYDGKLWWYFEEASHMWKMDKSGTHIHSSLVDLTTTHFNEWVRSEGVGGIGAMEKMEVASKLLVAINKRTFRDHLVKDCCVEFIDRTFRKKLNSKTNLVVCKNGVFDLEKQEFRPGRPSDFCSMSTNRNFRSGGINPECMQFLDNIFDRGNEQDTNEVRDMMLKSCAWHLGGGTYNKLFVWVGEGANGKSKLAHLFRLAFGDYVCNLPTQLITQKRADSGKPLPEVQRAEDRRMVFISEPAQNETLNMGIVKELTGGDSMYSRGLYDDGHEMTHKFQINLLSNETPNISGRTDGDWRRLLVFYFKSKFCERPDPKNPFEKLLDPNLDEKLEQWADAFMAAMLVKVYPHCTPILHIPKCIAQAHEEYREEEDYYATFYKERIFPSGLSTDVVNWVDFYDAFYRSHGRSQGYNNMPKKSEAKKAFQGPSCFNQKLHKGVWTGFMMPGPCTSRGY